jgi:hypothetical protein
MVWRVAHDFDPSKADEGGRFGRTSVHSSLEFEIEGNELNAHLGPAVATWPLESLNAVHVEVVGTKFPPMWSIWLDHDDGSSELMRTTDQMDALILGERIGAHAGVRFVEHTGREVEPDEHGLSVIQQIALYPDRWDRPSRTETMRGRVESTEDAVIAHLPSELPTSSFVILAISVLLAITAGPASYLAFVITTPVLGLQQLFWVPLLGFFTIILCAAWVNQIHHSVESRHRLTISSRGIELRGMLLGLIPMPATEAPLYELRDMDATDRRGLTVLIGDRRLNCSMDAMEAECLIGEIATELERIGAIPSPTSSPYEEE